MIPPKGFKNEVYPLRHRLKYAAGLSMETVTKNSVFFTILRHSSEIVEQSTIEVNPHNTAYDEETGAMVAKMSIIDKVRISLRFNATELWNDSAHTSGVSGAEVFTGDGIHHIHLLWRPIFFSFREKLQAVDDDTGTSVEAILALTSEATFEDVVPLTTTKLQTGGDSNLPQPVSTVHHAEAYTDYNMTTDTDMEEHVWDENLFQNAMKRYTIKGALKSMVGRTRHVNLTRNRPFKNFYIDKFVPKSIRRVMPYTFFGIQIHLPTSVDVTQDYYNTTNTANGVHVGVKAIIQYHEWNADHHQEMTGTGV